MKIKTSEIPEEVLYVVAMQQVGFVGSETYSKIQEIIGKYPEYFPWEHKYSKVPTEVHEAYRKEERAIYDEVYPREKIDREGGILAQLSKQVKYGDIPTMSFEDFVKNEERIKSKKDELETRLKRAWSNHYGKYKLEYRG